jgi:tetratricopeptide (TPR) repeat protein
LKYMPPRMKNGWDPSQLEGFRTPQDFGYSRREFEADLKAVNGLNTGGVGMLAGTDSQNPYIFYGFSLHDELELLVRAGLSPMQALEAATLNPARFFGMENDLGTVDKGKLADLVLLNANPLEAISNTRRIEAVIYRGKLYPRASLDEMLSRAERLAARPLIGSILFATIQEKGVDAAIRQYRELSSEQPDSFDFSERELIGCGYRLIHMKKYKDAIEIFKLSVETYPQSYNTYDSLAEAYMDNGDKELALANYQRSLQLNPENTNARQMMRKINAQ